MIRKFDLVSRPAIAEVRVTGMNLSLIWESNLRLGLGVRVRVRVRVR